MGLEFTEGPDDPIDFTDATEIPTTFTQTEQVSLRLDDGAARRDEARRADQRWVYCMSTIAKFDGSPGIMALSDGITSHMVTWIGISKDAEDYLVLYHDPWGPERGSFLQRGKNIAGCTATPFEGHPGVWAVRAGQLSRVLDSVIIISPREDQDERTSDSAPESG